MSLLHRVMCNGLAKLFDRRIARVVITVMARDAGIW